ncbi:hypothetical protein [Chryseobacterium daecheongense]|uniref:Lipoprotein n=1 Tax=Chryseobacterium daecheongense TaxID=192389 RepID=A0A3N0W9L1_9FLAO|nr:hypothetical protein [Chryseobacterium daecheongense]ROI00789.1 hypothetical protein EGI05_07930 [Chryseobacterium daecheongense]TDX90260.1 hypothetical protein BCF50_3451 [Chryseobacterium daecheongense]
MIKLYTLIATLLLFFLSCTKNDIKYSVGQEWKYKTRSTEKGSTLKILKIEEYPNTGKVIHISVSGLKIKSPESPDGFANQLSHIPISEEALNKSVTKLQNETRKMPDSLEMDGYSYWKKEFDNGNAGIFSIPVSEIVSLMEESIVTGNYTK